MTASLIGGSIGCTEPDGETAVVVVLLQPIAVTKSKVATIIIPSLHFIPHPPFQSIRFC
jgi:hypothetical protein